MLKINEVHQGDCLEFMKLIPDEVIDAIITDLPFGSTKNSWDKIIPFEPLWEQYKRITKKNAAIVLMAIQPFASQLVMSNIDMFRYDLVWEKNKKTGFLNAKKMPLRAHEIILVFYQQLPIYNPQMTYGHNPVHSFTKHTGDGTNYGKTKIGITGGGQTSRHPTSIVKIPVVNNDSKEKYHPLQKPVALFEWLIKTYTDEGMIVLDSCAGSFTTAEAARNLKRNWICIEKEEKYCEIGRKRLSVSHE